MNNFEPIHLKPYQIATEFCDCEHPQIVAKAQELTATCTDDYFRIDAIRKYIRTQIPYRLDYCSVKASETLEKGWGMCTNKATLQIALMRAIGIPAAYGLVHITKEAFRGMLPELFDAISEPTTHCFACAWVAKKERFYYVDGTESEKDEHRFLVELATGETRYQDRWLRGDIMLHSNLDHLFTIPSRWSRELFEEQNEQYQAIKPV